MYLGWLMFAGNEIANAARTEAYVRNLLPTFGFKNVYRSEFLEYAIEEPLDYDTPAADDAPWYDPGAPESAEFLGLYLLDVQGVPDSTADANIVEGIDMGGSVGALRFGTRDIKVKGLLIGQTHEGAQAGFTWLKSVLAGSPCSGNCDGDDLCFLIATPTNAAHADRLVRKIREVTRVNGPTMIRERRLNCGGWMIEVEFLLVAGSPWIYGEPTLVAAAEGASMTAYVAGSTIELIPTNLPTCTIPISQQPTPPIIDPDCPPIPAAPTMPVPTEACADMPTNWKTYSIYVPDDQVDMWKDGVMQLQVVNGSYPLRFMRVRLLPRPLEDQEVIDLNPCSACGDMMVSYIPAGATMLIDGMTERASISVGNREPASANHLLAGTLGEVPEWPVFTCGSGYYVLVEIPTDRSLRSLALNIANRE